MDIVSNIKLILILTIICQCDVNKIMRGRRGHDHLVVGFTKSDGILVYSTCTINQEENEKQVVRTLKTFPQLALQSQV
jgi:hypothetical protein